MASEGFRRLSILLGVFGLLGWIIFALAVTEFFKDASSIQWQGWFILITGIPVSFFVPFLLVKGIVWVVEGFRNEKPKP